MKFIITLIVILIAVVLGSLYILALALLIYSPGKPDPFLDDNGKPLPNSISEKVFLNIVGIRQGMFIKSKNKKTRFCFTCTEASPIISPSSS